MITGAICNITDNDRSTRKVYISTNFISEIEKGDREFNDRASGSKMAFCNPAGTDLSNATKKDATED